MKRREVTHRAQRNCWEGFHWDTNLVQIIRWMYFEVHCPTFNQEGSHDLSSLFREMITSADLLESEIHEIQEVWDWMERPSGMPIMQWGVCQGSLIFPPCVPFGVAKGYGTKRDSSSWCTLPPMGLSYCPWCRKEGQNEGTVLNYLCTTLQIRTGLPQCLPSPWYFWVHEESCKSASSPDPEEKGGPTMWCIHVGLIHPKLSPTSPVHTCAPLHLWIPPNQINVRANLLHWICISFIPCLE